MVSLTVARRMKLREEKLETRESNQVQVDQSLRPKSKEAEGRLGGGTHTVIVILGCVQGKMAVQK